MSLVRDYCVTCDAKGNYILDFNTTEAVSVSFLPTEKDGTNVITVKSNRKGGKTFTNNYGNGSKIFKYAFEQYSSESLRTTTAPPPPPGQPSGTMGP